MELLEKKKRGRPKGSSKIKPPELVNSIESRWISAKSTKDLIDCHRAKIEDWLNGTQDYNKGLSLLSKDKNKIRVFLKLNSKESDFNKQKLVHELTAFLYRTKPRVISKKPEKDISPASNAPEDIAAMENLSISEKIKKWLDGPKDYQMGRKLLRIVPGQHLHYLQLYQIETYECRVRLLVWLKGALEYIRDEGK